MYKYIFYYCFLLYFLPRYLAKLLQNSSFREREIVRAVPSASSSTFPSALLHASVYDIAVMAHRQNRVPSVPHIFQPDVNCSSPGSLPAPGPAISGSPFS